VSEEKQLRECSSCQTVNDNSAQFCLECGQKLAPVGRGAAPDEQAPAAPSSGRPRLHSPILGGYEDIDDSPRKPKEPKITAPRAKGAHLRSPLLGGNDGEDDDEEVFDDTAMKPGKGKPQGAHPYLANQVHLLMMIMKKISRYEIAITTGLHFLIAVDPEKPIRKCLLLNSMLPSNLLAKHICVRRF
jgi:hypothetical protein